MPHKAAILPFRFRCIAAGTGAVPTGAAVAVGAARAVLQQAQHDGSNTKRFMGLTFLGFAESGKTAYLPETNAAIWARASGRTRQRTIRPSRSVVISPAARSSLRWWVRVDGAQGTWQRIRQAVTPQHSPLPSHGPQHEPVSESYPQFGPQQRMHWNTARRVGSERALKIAAISGWGASGIRKPFDIDRNIR